MTIFVLHLLVTFSNNDTLDFSIKVKTVDLKEKIRQESSQSVKTHLGTVECFQPSRRSPGRWAASLTCRASGGSSFLIPMMQLSCPASLYYPSSFAPPEHPVVPLKEAFCASVHAVAVVVLRDHLCFPHSPFVQHSGRTPRYLTQTAKNTAPWPQFLHPCYGKEHLVTKRVNRKRIRGWLDVCCPVILCCPAAEKH